MTHKSRTYKKSLRIESSAKGERLDQSLAQCLSDISRAQLTKWIKDGSITVEGQTHKPSYRLSGGERVVVNGSFPPQVDWTTASEMSIPVVYEDEDLLVINKPAGLVVHPGAATVEPTLANGLLAMRPQLRDVHRAGIVHRLDKDTTGLMIVAHSIMAYSELSAALTLREVSRAYLSIVEGRLSKPREVDFPLGRSPRDRTRQTVREDGRAASTLLTPVVNFPGHTLVRAELRTGRTHQIRVHAARIGLPLVGDLKYGAKRLIPPNAPTVLRELLRKFPRQALHADQLSFRHPRTGKEMRFEIPLPDDMAELLKLLREGT